MVNLLRIILKVYPRVLYMWIVYILCFNCGIEKDILIENAQVEKDLLGYMEKKYGSYYNPKTKKKKKKKGMAWLELHDVRDDDDEDEDDDDDDECL